MRSLFDIFDEPEVQIRESESNIVLRPYQVDAVDAVFEQWNAGSSATLIVLPTGTGKSVCFSEVMRRWMESNP